MLLEMAMTTVIRRPEIAKSGHDFFLKMGINVSPETRIESRWDKPTTLRASCGTLLLLVVLLLH